jgi:acyl-CoA thioester hydrolase
MTPATHEVQMRWRDLDGLGHVSHNVALIYLEEGRDAFLGTCGIGRRDYVVGRCSVTFLGEIVPELRTVTAECSIAAVGGSSLTTSERLLGESGDVLVEAEFGLVLWDAERHASRPVTDAERAALTRPEEVPA